MQSIKKAWNEEQQSINTQSSTKYIRNIYIVYYLFWNNYKIDLLTEFLHIKTFWMLKENTKLVESFV